MSLNLIYAFWLVISRQTLVMLKILVRFVLNQWQRIIGRFCVTLVNSGATYDVGECRLQPSLGFAQHVFVAHCRFTTTLLLMSLVLKKIDVSRPAVYMCWGRPGGVLVSYIPDINIQKYPKLR